MRSRLLFAVALVAWMIGAPIARAQDEQSFEKIERGRYLAVLGDCVACHTAPDGKPFAGGLGLETPFGALVGPNITPDLATGIGAWSEADFWRTMHEGIGKNGVRLYPAMPYPAYTKVTREDVSAIWAYLRTLEPIRNEIQSNQLMFPFNVRRPATSVWNLINFQPGVFQPDTSKIGNLEPRGLSGRRSRPLRYLPHAKEHYRWRPRRRSTAGGAVAGLVRAGCDIRSAHRHRRLVNR
jgi:mono/diheme cytochrome c family protein